ncbi:MAG: DUF3285 domain-containing protein [Elainellaceae cyanobacterium]
MATSDRPSSDSPSADLAASQPQDSYVKLAMRNMVKKGRQSLVHFSLTVAALLGVLIGLAYLTR